MSAVRIASIIELCAADHGNDPVAIADWTANKSAEAFLTLLQQPGVQLLVAELDGRVVGVGGLWSDTITLNYVHPDYRFRGVSKALVEGIEAELVRSGVTTACLHSTVTALPFYRALGWMETGGGTPEAGHPMTKMLVGI